MAHYTSSFLAYLGNPFVSYFPPGTWPIISCHVHSTYSHSNVDEIGKTIANTALPQHEFGSELYKKVMAKGRLTAGLKTAHIKPEFESHQTIGYKQLTLTLDGDANVAATFLGGGLDGALEAAKRFDFPLWRIDFHGMICIRHIKPLE